MPQPGRLAFENPARFRLQTRYPALDGLRGLAILLVFAKHYGDEVLGYSWLGFGWVGVDVFFVLSGFLITGILADTLGKPRALRTFHAHRARRIVPLYFLFWTVIALLRCAGMVQVQPLLWHWPLYAGNLFTPGQVKQGLLFSIGSIHLNFAAVPSLQINHFWSLCVEAQFYLVWPLVLLALRSPRARQAACVAGIAFSVLLRFALWHLEPNAVGASEWIYHQTLTRLDGLLLGSLVALLLRTPGGFSLRRFRQLRALLLVVPGALLLHFGREILTSETTITLGLALVPLAATGILLCCLLPDNPLGRLCRVRPLTWLGGISYGFYLLHNLPQNVFLLHNNDLHNHHLAQVAVALCFAVTCALAWLSARFFEGPMRRLKRHARAESPPIARVLV